MNPIDPLTQLKKLRDTSLFPPARKQAVRKNLLTHMTLRAPRRVGLSFWQRLTGQGLSRPWAVVLASVTIIVVASAGTAAAASRALPGQVLYSVKTHVNEPVRAALIMADNDRAIYETELAAKRIEEAHTLAAEGQLDEVTQEQLAADFADHVQQVHTRVQNIQTEHFDEVQALLKQAQTKLQTRDYEAAAELGRRASAMAHGRSAVQREEIPANPEVKGQSDSIPNLPGGGNGHRDQTPSKNR